MDEVELVVRSLNGKLNSREDLYFREWLNKSDENKRLYSELKLFKESRKECSELNIDEAWKKVYERSIKIPEQKRSLAKYHSWYKYAAVFIGLFALGYGLIWNTNKAQSLGTNADNNIILELDNGETIVLQADDTETLLDENGLVVGKKTGNQLTYDGSKQLERLVFNKLSVPYGKRFDVTLSDGTVIHLNAGSSLRYPVTFLEGRPRQVFLEGEAFFDVSENAKNPFIVSTLSMNVTVTGTEFNVTSYPEELFTQTVLVEGAVTLSRVSKEGFPEPDRLNLEPGYLANWNNKTGESETKKVDTYLYTSWTTGKMILKGLPFKNVVKRIERKYDVKIQNNFSELEDHIFTAQFEEESIEDVMRVFALNKYFEYTIKENVITINKP